MSAAVKEGYLVSDRKKCSGCMSCMMACSLVHEGKIDLSLSRIQIVQETWGRFPDDIALAICRQCQTPKCVEACPTEALHVHAANGNVSMVDETLCNSCMVCRDACPYKPSRVVWHREKDVAVKCDLCINTPYWDQKGGPGGRQACVEICPMRCIKLVHEAPDEATGYDVNLRNKHWGWLGFPTD
jgi:protein NrfC